MGTSRRIFLFAVSLILVCAVVVLGFLQYARGTDLIARSSNQLASLEGSVETGEYYAYDGEILSGKEIKTLYAKYHLKGLKFEISTKECLTAGEYFSEINDGIPQSDKKYINEDGSFRVKVIEQRGEVVGFHITQQ